MNSGVSNCIEVRKFWEYSTDLRSNIFDRVRIIFCKIFIEFISNSNCIVSNYIDLSRTVRLSPLPSEDQYSSPPSMALRIMTSYEILGCCLRASLGLDLSGNPY
jgi:hypothetical protein